ncbi:hypothetical protein CR194_01365 [Salipaludibacillus keqinensis]|uniref:Uncharacterized protein n=1 Tax=Salipaludibacillus keqinensis TaxID=2045207 RepID=A0A323TJ42_9BACI|nr:hypothetical protein [Salipaludibacillus keqinensis]PYZ94216.1 hypothetical protein CR194_01365 [Salipaludibacillus keqinensis]
MSNQIKYVISLIIFLVIFTAGAFGHVALTKSIIEAEHDQQNYGGFQLDGSFTEFHRFQPRQYIKVIPEKKQKEGN